MAQLKYDLLKDLSNLNSTEYSKWLNTQIAAGKATVHDNYDYLNRLYKNQQYVAKYGMDDFYLKTAEERDLKYKDDAHNSFYSTFNARYDDKSREAMGNIVSPEALIQLYESGYMNSSDLLDEKNRIQAEREKMEAESKRLVENPNPAQYFNAADPYGVTHIVSYNSLMNAHSFNYEHAIESLHEKQDEKIKAAEKYDTEVVFKLPEIIKIKDAFMLEYAKRLLNGEEAAVNKEISDFLSTRDDNGQPLFPHYTTYANESELENLDIKDKIDLYTDFLTLNYYGQHGNIPHEISQRYFNKSISVVNQKLQNEVNTNRDFWDRAGINTKAIGTKTLASLGNTILGTYAFFIDDDKEKALFLLGKDTNGNDLPSAFNLNYYTGVDQFNVFSPLEIEKARANGGLSPYLHVRKFGEEYKWLTKESFGEGFSMIGYSLVPIALDILLTKGAASAGNATIRSVLKSSLKLTTKNGFKNIIRATSTPMRFAGDAARLGLHSIGEGTMEGKNNFDFVLDQSLAEFDGFLNTPEGNDYINQLTVEAIQQLYPDGIPSSDNPLNNFNIWALTRTEIIEQEREKYIDKATDAALDAYETTVSSFIMKNSATDLLFSSYMFAGRAPFSSGKNKYLKFFNNKAKGRKINAWDVTKALTKSQIGGFIEEATDEMVNIGALELGLMQTNSYIEEMYKGNTEPYLEKGFFLCLDAFKRGTIKALHDEATWHQAFVGLISPFTQIAPNVAGMVRYATMSNKQRNDLSFVEKLNSFLFNPMVANLSLEVQESKYAEQFADFYNEASLKYRENLQDVSKSFTLISDLQKGRYSSDPKTLKDNEHMAGFKFVSDLYKMAEQGDSENIASLYFEKLEKMSRGDISAEDLALFLQKVENRDQYDSENGKKEAVKVIQNNAKKLLKLFNDYDFSKKNYEKAFGNILSQESIEQLTYMSVLTPHWQERKKTMERELGITTSSRHVSGQKTKRGLAREIELLHKNIESIEKITQNTKSKSKLKVLKSIRNKLTHDLERLQIEESYDVEIPILTENEILNASAEERYNMFVNRTDYTPEQIEYIEKAETLLQEKDFDWEVKLKDIALLEKDIDLNRELLAALSKNPQELEDYILYVQESYYNNLLHSYTNFNVDELDMLLQLHEVGSEGWHSTINKYGKGIITALKNQYQKEGKLTKPLEKALNKAEKLADLFSNLHNVINQSELPNDVKRSLKQNILDIIGNATSYSKALEALQDALNNPNIAEDLKDLIRTLLEKAKKVELLKKSTIEQEKKQKKKGSIKDNEEEKAKEDDSKPQDDQEYAITDVVDVNLDENITVEEELPESEEKEPSKMNLEDFVLFGNSILGYPLKKLQEGVIEISKGALDNDFKSTYFKWLERNGLYPQRIVDYELNAYKALGIPLQVAMIRLPKEGADSPMNAVASKTLLLVIKADDRVKRIHKDSNSKYIIINDLEYLVAGNLGFKTGNDNQRSTFFELIDLAKIARKEYFDKEENKDEEFFLLPDQELSIGNITSGHLVHQLEEDVSKQQRSISTLLNEAKRNPRGISWNDLIWVIPTEIGFKTNKNISLPNSFFDKTKGQYARTGQLFLAIKDPRGKFITVQMKRYKSEDILDGTFKDKILKQINDMLDGVVKRDHDKRLTAVKELSKYLLFLKEGGDNILIGTDLKHSITVKVDGLIHSFSEQDIANNKQQVIDVILGNKEKGIPGKFNIVVTQNTITDISKMKELDEAGVLTTDIAVLSTAGAQYSVIKGEAKEENKTSEQPKTPIKEYTRKESVILNGKTYRYINNKYVNENGQEVDRETLDKIEIMLLCLNRPEDYNMRGSSYYILNLDANNLFVVAISGRSNTLKKCSNQEALAVIRQVQEKNMLDNIENSAEDITLDIEQEKNQEKDNKTLLDTEEKINTSNEKVDVFEKNLGKNLHMSENSFTFAQLSRHPNYRITVRDLLTKKFGKAYTEAVNKESFLKSKGITTTAIQDVDAWMEHIENCK